LETTRRTIVPEKCILFMTLPDLSTIGPVGFNSLSARGKKAVAVAPFLGPEPTGNITVTDVLKGKTFSDSSRVGLTCTQQAISSGPLSEKKLSSYKMAQSP